MDHYCLSINAHYLNEIRAGRKQYELRKVASGIKQGDLVVIYEKLPIGSINAAFRAGVTIKASPEDIWREYNKQIGINKKAFFDYFEGKGYGYAIEIKEFREFDPLSLGELRERYEFRPPQSIVRLPAGIEVAMAERLSARRSRR